MCEFDPWAHISYSHSILSLKIGCDKDSIEHVNMVTTKFGKPPLRSYWGYLLDPPFIMKKEDPGHPTIKCSIGQQTFHNALCDLGSGVNIMSKVTYDNL